MIKWIFKYTFRSIAVICFLLAIFSTWLWVRSYETADRVHGRAWEKESFLIGSKEGRTVWYWFTSHGHEQWWQWECRSYRVDDELSFPVGPIRQYQSRVGFGKMGPAFYFVMSPNQRLADGTTVTLWGAATATLNGNGLIIPFWFVVLSLLLIGVLFSADKPWRFSLRRMLLVVAVVAAVLALGSVLDPDEVVNSPPPPDETMHF